MRADSGKDRQEQGGDVMDKMKIGETIYDAVGMVVLIVFAAFCEEWFGTPVELNLLITVLWQLLMLRSAANGEGRR